MCAVEKLKWRQRLIHVLMNELERQTEAIFKDAEYFWQHPELASNEVHTSHYIIEVMRAAGLTPKRIAQTGIYADIGNQVTKLGIIADMDGIEVDGFVQHACGHHAQLTHLLGVARVLSNVQLSGFRYGVRMIAAPAEELGRSRWRDQLLLNRKLTSPSGKMCLYHEGVFEPLQALICCHLADDLPERTLLAGYRTNGCVTVTIRLPSVGMSKDVQKVISVFQDAVRLYNQQQQQQEILQIRFDMSGLEDAMIVIFLYGAKNLDVQDFISATSGIVHDASRNFVEGRIQIVNVCDAYVPLVQNDALSKRICKSAQAVGYTVKYSDCKLEGFTDLGFLSGQIAVCHPLIGGTRGITHTAGFRVTDPVAAYIMPVRMLLEVIVDYHLIPIS